MRPLKAVPDSRGWDAPGALRCLSRRSRGSRPALRPRSLLRDLRGLFFLQVISSTSQHFLAGSRAEGGGGCGWSSGWSGRRWGAASPPPGPRLQRRDGWNVVQQPVHGCSADAPAGVPGRAGPSAQAARRGRPCQRLVGRRTGPGSGGLAGGHSRASLFPGSSLRLPIQQPQGRRWGMASRALTPSSLRRSHLLHALPLERRPPAPAWSMPAPGAESGIPAHPQPGPREPAFPAAPVGATSNGFPRLPDLFPLLSMPGHNT